MTGISECPDFSNAELWFSRDYADCRSGFLRQASTCSAPKQQRKWPAGLAPHPELVTDTLWLGASEANRILVLISGTHGVEGYCGSAIQQFLLAHWTNTGLAVAEDSAILMIHALNPWGMANARRCDADGIDLNRNFRDFSQPLAIEADYSELLDAMSLTDSVARACALSTLRQRWGERRFQQILCGGQAEHPWAPFYSGTAPARGNRVIDEIIAEYDLDGRELVVLDLHSGLGPYSHGELICDHPEDSAGERYARSLFGAAVASTPEGQSFSVPLQGLQDFRWHQLMQQHGCFLTLEFGSYPAEQLFSVLLEEHLYWRLHGRPDPTSTERADMLDHFCPEDSLWMQAVLFRSWQCAEHVLEFFAHA